MKSRISAFTRSGASRIMKWPTPSIFLQLEVGEGVAELVGPGEGDDGVAVAPEDARGRLDLLVGAGEGATAEGGAVAVEAAAQRARLRVGLDVGGDLVVGPEVLVGGPCGEEVAEVHLGGLRAGADEVFGPRLLVEELVPGVEHVRQLEPASADAGVGRVEEHELVQAFRVEPREPLHPDGAEVVRDDAHLIEVVEVAERLDVLGEGGVGVADLGREIGLVGVGVAAHVGDDDVVVLGERIDVHVPLEPEAGPAVDEEQRLAGALADVVELDAVHGDLVVADLVDGHAGPPVEGRLATAGRLGGVGRYQRASCSSIQPKRSESSRGSPSSGVMRPE